jgi:aminoglycoside phosphotransferase family enzyme
LSADAAPTRGSRISLAAKVAFLKRAASYPDRPGRVEAIETHMSWVFLTRRHAYKLKKPARTDFLDFASIAARRRHCLAEVRLNRPLAKGIYLGVVCLVTSAGRRLRLVDTPPGGTERVVDWLVKMRRLPADERLDVLIGRGEVSRNRLEKALGRMAGFYREASQVGMSPSDYGLRIEREIGLDHQALALPTHRLRPALTERVLAAQRAFLSDHADWIEQRAQHVIEGHGDLRPEHIYLLAEPVIVDRLEFNRDLRLVDPVEEIAFLAMECERLGAAWVGDLAFDLYRRDTGDLPPDALLAFYRSRRACVRARLAIWHLADPAIPVASPWLDLAARYLELAERYLDRMPE